MGKSSINGAFSMAMLHNQRVTMDFHNCNNLDGQPWRQCAHALEEKKNHELFDPLPIMGWSWEVFLWLVVEPLINH